MNLFSEVFNMLGTILIAFSMIMFVQNDKVNLNLNQFQKSNRIYFRSLIIIILCFFIFLFSFLKINRNYLIGIFSITVMLFLATKVHPKSKNELEQLEILVDTKSIVTGLQILLILIFTSFYGFFFYNLWITKTEIDPSLLLIVYIITFLLILIEFLKVIFTKIYQ